MSFIKSPQCSSRSACFDCRNNENFRSVIKDRFRDWECPE